MLSLARTCRSLYAAFSGPTLGKVTNLRTWRTQECLFALYRRVRFHFDHPGTAQTVLQRVPHEFLKEIRAIHVNCGHYSEKNMAIVLQLAEANPCGLHLCGMGNVLNKATRTKMSPPSQVTLQDWLLQVAGSLSVGFALRHAEKRGEKLCSDPSSKLAEIVTRRLGGTPAEESMPPDCLQACTLSSGNHDCGWYCSESDTDVLRWHTRCFFWRTWSRVMLEKKLVKKERKLWMKIRRYIAIGRMRQHAANAVAEESRV